jgi:eukaryotic-like serine/threonine-protein kinase
MRPEDMVGQTLGHYRIVRPLGQGGTAIVFLAQDIHLHRDVAIKVFQPREDDTQDFLRRFAREARVLAQLDHPNILPVYEYGEEDTLAFLVMPHMAGGSLRDWLRRRGAVSVPETIRLLSQMLSALQYAHERNLIHRDIKPGNMLFKADGTLMLSDFGLVKVLTGEDGTASLLNDSTSITAQELTGTPDYMAPEQIQGRVVPASDIYAIGVVLYEMLTGSHLFDADNYIGVLVKHMYEQPRPVRDVNPQISPELEAVVMRALYKEPARRYQHPEEMRQALLQALREDATSVTNRNTEPTTIIPSVSPTSYPSMPGIESIHAHQQPPPMHLHTPQSMPLTPTSSTQSDAHPATHVYPLMNMAPVPPSYAPLPPYTPPPPFAPASRPRSNKPLVGVLVLVILVLIGSLGGVLYTQRAIPPPALPTVTPRPSRPAAGITPVDKGSTAQTTGNTQAVPATQTDCPISGQARAAITAPLVLGTHPNVIYIVNEGTPDNPTYGTIKRRDADPTITTGVEISKMAHTSIGEAQVSKDGQWVLFVANTTNGVSELRMVRVDGQGLQTLYCAPAKETISSSQWSFDQRTIVFNAGSGVGLSTMYLLDVTTGNVQVEFVPQSTLAYAPRTWLDNTHIYLTSSIPNSDAGLRDLYILDIEKGADQNDKDLQKIVPGLQPCGSFDSSYDLRQLLISSCQLASPTGGGLSVPAGPTTITSEAVTGGPMKTILALRHAVTMLRAVSPTTLLLLVENASGDISHNGLWEMNTDGTGLMQLTTDKQNAQSLCQFSQYAWSNVSRDGTLYALQEIIPNADANKDTYNMYYGSMSSGLPNEFASIVGTQLLLAGWTSL